uniref:NADH:ubiquinone oxidoreductase subunit V3 n=1 Tax=Podarcis muralis TaxID=64176 RepID=A0A670K9J2_PODMU|nr:NADH dehydrogenase [ubiquinone] flavoprotein 3, mitochondrial [Podarcis muralis]
MATALLISCGRTAVLKTFKLQAWGLRSVPPAVSLCTKPGGDKKVSKKNKGEIINTKPDAAVKLKDEDLRKYLAKKTVVKFPQRAKLPSLEGQSVVSSTAGLGKKKGDEETSSSSSSESDSSSDSDEEDSAFEDTIKTKVSFPSRDPPSSGDRTKKAKIRSEKHVPQEQVKGKAAEKLPYSPGFTESPVKQKEVHQTTAGDKLLWSDLSKSATNRRHEEARLKSTDFGTKVAESQRPTDVAKPLEASPPEASPLGATSSTLSRTQSVPQQNAAQNLTLPRQGGSVAMEAQKTDMQGKTAAVPQGELLDGRVPAAETTVKEEIALEAGVQTEQQSAIQEAEPPAETAPETFDMSTYKNLQHHDYTSYTFVDYDVQLAKFRLPQPSSGRVSPRH